MRYLLVLVLAVALAGCASSGDYVAPLSDTVPMTDTSSNLRPGEAQSALYVLSACDIPAQDGELIRLNAIYRWDGQAWGLHPPEPCPDSAGSGGIALETSRLRARAGNQPAFEALEQLARDEQAIVEVVGTFWSSPDRVVARSLRAQVYRGGDDRSDD